jgi:hypothetical protein
METMGDGLATSGTKSHPRVVPTGALARVSRLGAALASAGWITLFPVALLAEELPPEAAEAVRKGVAAMGQKQWLLAEQQFKIAAEKAYGVPEVALAVARFNDARGGRDIIAAYWYRAYVAARPNDPQRDELVARIDALERNALSTARGLIDKALAATNSIAAPDRANPLTQIANAQAKLGDLAAAYATASNARSANPNSTDPYGEIASVLATKGDLAGTEDALRRVDQSHRASALRGVVYSLTAAKRPSDALAFAAPISGQERITAFSYIANSYSQAGDKRAARSNLEAAIQAVNTLDPAQRPYFFLNLVQTAAELAEFETAKRLYADVSKTYAAANVAKNSYLVSSSNFNLMNARWHMVNGFAQAGRLAEGEAMFATLAPDTSRPRTRPPRNWQTSESRSNRGECKHSFSALL